MPNPRHTRQSPSASPQKSVGRKSREEQLRDPGRQFRPEEVRSAPCSDLPISDVWLEYKRCPTDEIRNYLIEHYIDIVRYTAERMHMRLPGDVDVEDLMSAGLLGLMNAIDAFDLERGVKFETYCAQRIRGAIFDELRAMDWVPRSRTATADRARGGSFKDYAEREEFETESRQKHAKDSSLAGVVALNIIKDLRQENPLTEIQKKDLEVLITKGLSRAERLIVILYYYEEMTIREIGMMLDLAEARVNQMHSSILARLKAQVQHRTTGDALSKAVDATVAHCHEVRSPPPSELEQISASEARKNFAEVLNRVAFGKTRIELQRHGKTVAAIVPAEDLAQLDADSMLRGRIQ